MATVESLTAEITDLESLINSGATTVVQDGQTVSFNQPAARKRLRELQAKLEILQNGKKRRPRVFSPKLR